MARHSWWKLAISIAAIGFAAVAAYASETITYTYDPRGRLVKVEHASTINDGVKTEYQHDKADNRTNVTVTGVPDPPSLAIGNASVAEGGTLPFTVTKTGGGAASASWTTANGTATAGSDYTAASLDHRGEQQRHRILSGHLRDPGQSRRDRQREPAGHSYGGRMPVKNKQHILRSGIAGVLAAAKPVSCSWRGQRRVMGRSSPSRRQIQSWGHEQA